TVSRVRPLTACRPRRAAGCEASSATASSSGHSPAGSAQSKHIEAVAVGLEAFSVGEFGDGAGDLLFEVGWQGHVGDLAAVDAQQVVVVLGKIFGQFEARVFVVGGDPPDESGGMQVGQVPVGGAARHAGQALGDVFDAHGVAGADEQLDDGPPS